MVQDAGGTVVGLGFVIELTFLGGRQRLDGHDVFSLLQYDK
jgi:adenine phosphoribosyltransferase